MQFEVVLEVVKATVSVFLLALELAMTARAILSWFPIEPNRLTNFLHGMTEPFVYPIRKLFEKLNWFQNIPLDMSFMVTFMLISILLFILP